MKEERGQALVILAFALIALAAFAGLAIDGGRLYEARRQAQNTADAVAVAGARKLAEYVSACNPPDTPTIMGQAVAEEVVRLAVSNGIDASGENARLIAWYVDKTETMLGPVAWGAPIPTGAAGISVTLITTDTTTFLRIVGQENVVAPGRATAMAGPVIQFTGGGVLPLGVWVGLLDELSPGDEFTFFDDETFCRGEPCDFTGSHIPNSLHGWLNMRYIYNKSMWHTDLDRTFEKTVGNSGCAYNADGTVDVSGTGLRGWASGQCPYPYPIFAGPRLAYPNRSLAGDYIHGDPGMRSSTIGEVEEGFPPGALAYAPIFDYVFVTGDMEANFSTHEPDIGWVTAGGGVNASYMHIVGFVATRISSIDATGNNKHISGYFEKAIMGDGVITPSDGFNSGTCSEYEVMAVQLWR